MPLSVLAYPGRLPLNPYGQVTVRQGRWSQARTASPPAAYITPAALNPARLAAEPAGTAGSARAPLPLPRLPAGLQPLLAAAATPARTRRPATPQLPRRATAQEPGLGGARRPRERAPQQGPPQPARRPPAHRLLSPPLAAPHSSARPLRQPAALPAPSATSPEAPAFLLPPPPAIGRSSRSLPGRQLRCLSREEVLGGGSASAGGSRDPASGGSWRESG